MISAAASGREQLKRVQANIEVGKQPRSASAEVDVALAFRDQAVLLAEQDLAERALELGRLCGLRLDSQSALRLQAADAPAPIERALDERSTVEAALARNTAGGMDTMFEMVRREFADTLDARNAPGDAERAAALRAETLAAVDPPMAATQIDPRGR